MAGPGQQGDGRSGGRFGPLRGRVLVDGIGAGAQGRAQGPRVQATDPDRAAAQLIVQARDQATQAVLEAMGTLVCRADHAADIAPTADATLRMAFNTFRPTATLIGQRVLGAKTFGKE